MSKRDTAELQLGLMREILNRAKHFTSAGLTGHVALAVAMAVADRTDETGVAEFRPADAAESIGLSTNTFRSYLERMLCWKLKAEPRSRTVQVTWVAFTVNEAKRHGQRIADLLGNMTERERKLMNLGQQTLKEQIGKAIAELEAELLESI